MSRIVTYLFALMLLGLPQAALAATYYVSPTGSDTANGSSGTPWRTMQKAANTMVAGDTTIVRDGTYLESTSGLVFNFADGTAGNYITLKAENPHMAILSSRSGCFPSIDILRSYIKIEDLYLKVDASNVTCTSGTTANQHIHARPNSSPTIGGTQTTSKKGAWIKNVKADPLGGKRYGFFKSTQDDTLVENFDVYGELECLNQNNCIIRNGVTRTDGTANGILAKGGARNAQFYGNLVYLDTAAFSYAIRLGGCTGDAFFFDTAAKIECYNCAAHSNVVINRNGSATNRLFQFRSASNSKIFNNVGINGVPLEMSRSCATSPPSNENPTFTNNILIDEAGGTGYSMGPMTDYSGTFTHSYNNYRGYTSPPSQSNAVTGDPLLTNINSDWTSQSGSASIDAGTTVTMPAYGGGSLTVTTTRDGATRSGTWDLGPYEWGGTPPSPPPPPPPPPVSGAGARGLGLMLGM